LAVAVATVALTGNVTAAVATVLVACSCAIAMATPITVLAAVGHAAKRGIVIKGGRYLEVLAKVDTMVVDKTGTVTVGRPEVTDVVVQDGSHEAELLQLAASVERWSEHPLGVGIVRAARSRALTLDEPKAFDVIPGEGVTAQLNGSRVVCGTERLMARLGVPIDGTIRDEVRRLAGGGRSVVLLARDGRALGLIALPDV